MTLRRINGHAAALKTALFTAVCVLLSQSSMSDVKLPMIFGSDMVLQQDVPVKVWGWASPGEAVSVSFGGDKAVTQADEKGEWKLELPAQKASATPAKFIAKGTNEIVLDNVLVGEVWLCAGQSNMEMSFGQCFTNEAEAKAAAAKAGNSDIRIFPVQQDASSVPLRDLGPARDTEDLNKWKLCTPELLAVRDRWHDRGFSAVGYYFASELNKTLKVPVGLLWASQSGTGIDRWTAREGFEQVPSLWGYRSVQSEDPTSSERQQWLEKYLKDLEAWKQEARKSGDANRIDDPAGIARKQWLDRYLQELEAWQLEAKKALDTRTVLNRIPPRQKGGTWEFACDSQTGLKRLPPLCAVVLVPARDKKDIRTTYLFNGMVSPLIPFPIRGVIWYQGEANHRDGALYTEETKAHVGGLRQLWRNPSMPYYLVQIAPYPYDNDHPLILPLFWEAQYAITKAIPNTGIVGTTDVADLKDVHSRNKEPVGRRLALQALKQTYGKDVVADGPAFKSFSVEGSKLRALFDNVPTTLKSNDGKDLTWFEIIDADRGGFVKANAEIDGKTVVLSAPGVERPVGVRFGWNKIAVPNLINAEGLPAYPFRVGNEKAMRDSMPVAGAKP